MRKRKSLLWLCSKLTRSTSLLQRMTEELLALHYTSHSPEPSTFSTHLLLNKRAFLFPPHLLGLCLCLMVSVLLHYQKHVETCKQHALSIPIKPSDAKFDLPAVTSCNWGLVGWIQTKPERHHQANVMRKCTKFGVCSVKRGKSYVQIISQEQKSYWAEIWCAELFW